MRKVEVFQPTKDAGEVTANINAIIKLYNVVDYKVLVTPEVVSAGSYSYRGDTYITLVVEYET